MGRRDVMGECGAGWVRLQTDSNRMRILLARESLEAVGIETRILDQQDSMYPSLGHLHLYVRADQEARAREHLLASA